jgi:hypothetical protein
MDIQLYFELKVYPALQNILEGYNVGIFDDKMAIESAKHLCNISDLLLSYNKDLYVMGEDAFNGFVQKLNNIKCKGEIN